MENLSFLADKYFNQNLICLIISYSGVVVADLRGLDCLQCASWIIFGLTLIPVIITTIFYTIEYCVRKWCLIQERIHDSKLKREI